MYIHIYIYIYIYVLPPTGQETLNNSTHLFKGGPPEAPSPEINPRSVPVGGLGGVCPWHAWKGICTSGFTSLRPLGYKLNLLEKLCVAVVLLASHPCIVCRLVPADSRFLPEDVLRRSDRGCSSNTEQKRVEDVREGALRHPEFTVAGDFQPRPGKRNHRQRCHKSDSFLCVAKPPHVSYHTDDYDQHYVF